MQRVRYIIKDDRPTARNLWKHAQEVHTSALVTVISIHGNEVEFQLGMFAEEVRQCFVAVSADELDLA
jgi:hypothetical protein